jgi:16S rRNA (adenine1518-N6/adenine1519-N6)-dimethyltransferase
MAHIARKRFGQHFLSDSHVVDRIVAAVAPRAGDFLVEIGPGLAALTDALLRAAGRLTAIEIDRDLAARLRARYGDRLALIEADVLRVDLREAAGGRQLRLVGNLPYNISSPLLVRLLDYRDIVVDQHFMLQKEVVDRIVAGPGTSAFGRLGVLLQAYYDVESLFDVPPESFDPPPKVDSAVIRMLPRIDPPAVRHGSLSTVLAAAFGQRRKMLRNTLIPWLGERGIAIDGLSPTDRPEDVDVGTYVRLAMRLEGSDAS